ncbi:MAG: pentapeptide repeat-containing protein [Aulosira sp. ZfuVER01]|nr:pentapeptide repeat-containing protein [Aulosira sp. ZfuVER01]MDZ7996682.1 pentapeptide repeat-containing protein [Aulosira sp. DedVER01a]MDZ8053732.1 pentapeptide repeat-containing protein [Aulosira sp. ZfuCHP01]
MSNLNYSNQILHDRSFKGQDLSGADFSGADLRGCNFTGATLIGANFQQVKTGQSQRQVRMLVVSTIVSPVVLCGSGALFVYLLSLLLSDRAINFLIGSLPVLFFFAEIFLRDSINFHFPQATTFFGIGAISILFAVMVALTIGLACIGFSGFGNGSSAQGFFFLIMAVVSAIVTFRIFQWLIQSIQSHPGTSFRKANLTDADFSYSELKNTDFSLAVLTGICIFKWAIKPYTDFTNVYCKYLYLEPEQQNRQPAEGNFQANELERVLTQFRR